MAGSSGTWLGDPGVFHGEGAYWDSRIGALRYVDMLRGDLLTLDSRAHVANVVAMVRARGDGGYVVATEHGFALLDDALVVGRSIPAFDLPDVRMNEGACDASGRLYCGSLAYDYREGGGTLYRLDPDLSVHVVLEGVTIPNGLVFVGDAALHADTSDGVVYRYDFDAHHGTLGAREVFIDFAETPGAPDGMALDAEGGLWVAMWGGRAVRRHDAAGRLTDIIELPVTNPTSCAIGGTTLYVTTSQQGLGDRVEERAGQVYAVDVGVRAAEVHAFGG